MAFERVIKTKSGDYVYKVEAYWDSELKKSRQRTACIGKRDKVTGALIPNRRGRWERAPGRILDYGNVAVCRAVAREAGLLEALQKMYGEPVGELLFLLGVFLVSEELPLSQFETWVEGVHHGSIGSRSASSSKAISKLLAEIGLDYDSRMRFQRDVLKRCPGDARTVLIDTTSISTYSELDGWASYGHNRDLEPLPQVNLQLTAVEGTGMPLALRLIEGSIPDVSTLLNAVKTAQSLGLEKPLFKLDRGYFSKVNMSTLADHQIRVLIPVPTRTALFAEALETYAKSLRKPSNAFTSGGDTYYAIHYNGTYDGRTYGFTLILNESRQLRETHRLIATLERIEQAFAEHPPKSQAAAVALLAPLPASWRKSVLAIRRGPDGTWGVKRKNKGISDITRRMGYVLLMSDADDGLSPRETLEQYRTRDGIEKLLDNLKNALGFDRLRVHTEQTVEGKLFVGLIALMLHAALQSRLESTKKQLGRRVSPREALLSFRRIKISSLPNGNDLISEADKKQKKLLDSLGLDQGFFSHSTHSVNASPI